MQEIEHLCGQIEEIRKNKEESSYIAVYKHPENGWRMFIDLYYNDEQSTERDFIIKACPFCGKHLE